MRKVVFLSLTLCFILLFCSACDSTNKYGGNKEYEVISVVTYPVIVGKNKNGPVEENRIAFIYMDNGNPKLIKDYQANDSGTYASYIVVGDVNKYVVVKEHRDETKYLYLTQDTYDKLFSGGKNE